MSHISKKLVRLAIMDALYEVLKGKGDNRLSKDTQMTIIESVEKIAETVQNDFRRDANKASHKYPRKKEVTISKHGRVVRSSAKKKAHKGT